MDQTNTIHSAYLCRFQVAIFQSIQNVVFQSSTTEVQKCGRALAPLPILGVRECFF